MKSSDKLFTEIDQEHTGQLIVLRIRGVLDALTATDLESKIFSLLSYERNKLLINVEGIDYISSAGLRTFLTTSRKIDGLGGKFILCSPSENVLLTIKNAGLDTFFKWEKNEAQALKFLKKS